MSNQLVLYLNRAAAGNIPAMIILKLMMLEIPNLIGLLLPLGFYVAVLVAYGRLYAENEMTVLRACGYGYWQLGRHTFTMALVVIAIVTFIVLWLGPLIAVERAKLLRTSGIQTLVQTLVPGRFRQLANGRQVFYVEEINGKHTKAHNIFLARTLKKNQQLQWEILWAKTAFTQIDPKTQEDYLIFKSGKHYRGLPGHGDFQIGDFSRYKIRLPHPAVAAAKDIRTVPTLNLLANANSDRRKAAELQWRLSVPIMVLVLTFLVLPLSHVNARSGKYAQLLPAIVIYLIYANFLFVARDWIIAQKIPPWLGVWWLHGIMFILGIVLLKRKHGRLV